MCFVMEDTIDYSMSFGGIKYTFVIQSVVMQYIIDYSMSFCGGVYH